jgi:hypothetical protein
MDLPYTNSYHESTETMNEGLGMKGRSSMWFTAASVLGVLGLGAIMLWFFLRIYAPQLVGPHREFFSRCDAIALDGAPHAVLNHMRGYVLANRHANRFVDDATLVAEIAPTMDKAGESSFLFYPNLKDTADWCVVYFRDERVVRTVLAPD